MNTYKVFAFRPFYVENPQVKPVGNVYIADVEAEDLKAAFGLTLDTFADFFDWEDVIIEDKDGKRWSTNPGDEIEELKD